MQTTHLFSGKQLTLFEIEPKIKCANRRSVEFSSYLSHEFYQVMVGDPRMTIHGWKQLAEWSIEHSCLSPTEIKGAKKIHAAAWEAFCQWIVSTYGSEADALMDTT